MGIYPAVPIEVAWAGSLAGGDVRKGVALAMIIGCGNLGGICSSFIYVTPPRFFVGHGMCMGWLSLTCVVFFLVTLNCALTRR